MGIVNRVDLVDEQVAHGMADSVDIDRVVMVLSEASRRRGEEFMTLEKTG